MEIEYYNITDINYQKNIKIDLYGKSYNSTNYYLNNPSHINTLTYIWYL